MPIDNFIDIPCSKNNSLSVFFRISKSKFFLFHMIVQMQSFNQVTAVKLFKETNPDVVLIDLNMPNGSGFYAIKKNSRD